MKNAIGIIKPPFQKIRGVVKPDGQKWLPFSAAYLHNPGGGHLYFMLDIIIVKGLLKHFSGMKTDPKYMFLHVFFLICRKRRRRKKQNKTKQNKTLISDFFLFFIFLFFIYLFFYFLFFIFFIFLRE